MRISTRTRVLGFVAAIFFLGWSMVAIVLLLAHQKWPAFVASGILFGGSFISWVITVHVLNQKNPEYVEALLSEDEEPSKNTHET